jgi:hypothetical protein
MSSCPTKLPVAVEVLGGTSLVAFNVVVTVSFDVVPDGLTHVALPGLHAVPGSQQVRAPAD